ncbi:MAG: dephospho-CoA kinase [Myxococcota bacterium]|nr:dephospho-CoA kinase [Myxococcota bacterium]
MITIGLTGGIATGKSTVATILRESLNVPVIDADQVSRDVVALGTPGLAELVSEFGPDILRTDGALDRKKLGEIVVSDKSARRRLERLTHPLIREEIEARLLALNSAGAAVAVVEAALLVETGSYRLYDHLIVVSAAPAVQLARLMARENLSEPQAQQWLDTQLPLERKEAVATVVIRNDGDLQALEAATLAAWETLEF